MRIVFLVLMCLALVPVHAIAQEEPVRTLPFEGPEVFCHILHHYGLIPLEQLDDLNDAPGHTILIMFGKAEILANIQKTTGGLDSFLKRGGNILIATDYPFTTADLRIGSRGVKIEQPEEHAFGGDRRCPRLPLGKLTAPQGRDPGLHPIFRAPVRSLAANCPSHLSIDAPTPLMQSLLDFPPDALRMSKGKAATKGNFSYIAGSPRDAPPNGRALFIAGHGIFMNAMMLQPSVDNFGFAINTVQWLRERPNDEVRRFALFVVDGRILNNFDMNLSPPAPPIPVPTSQMVNRLVRGLEDERMFHQVLSGMVDGNWDRVMLVLLSLMTAALLVYSLKKLHEGRFHPQPHVTLLAGKQAPFVRPGDACQQRNQSTMRGSDYLETSRNLVRDWLQAEFGITAPEWDAGLQAEFSITAPDGSERRRLTGHGALVLEFATGTKRTAFSRRQFFLLVSALQELARGIRAGQVTLLIVKNPVINT